MTSVWGYRYPMIMTQEEYDRRLAEAQEAGEVPYRDGKSGVEYTYDIYTYDGQPTGENINLRYTEGKAPETSVWDYGRMEIRLTHPEDRV